MSTGNIWKEAEKDIILHENRLNVIESCLDRHARLQPGKLAFAFELESGKIREYTYKELYEEANKFANYLNKLKAKEGSRVFIFLPKVPELYISFLGTIKQGSIAAPLFEAFQTEGLELRLKRGDADILVTNSELLKRLKHKIDGMGIINIDSAGYKSQISKQPSEFESVLKDKNDASVMIFTSSTAGTPVAGIQIPHYGLVQQHITAKLVLDLNENDNYWCTAHPGWITGSIYGILAPLSIGCSTYILEAHFDSKRWIDFIRKNKISVIYTAPTALRMLKPSIRKSDLEGVRNICSVGEALTSTLFNFYKKLGKEINDTYWQTETGAMVIANTLGMKKKPGSMGRALPGITARISNSGMIMLKKGFPAMMTGIYKHDAMYQSYFEDSWFKTNDLARIDSRGYFFFEARHDDIIKTSGERVSPIEIESILMKHRAIEEVAVIGVPDPIKGQIIKAFIVLNEGFQPSRQLKEELSMFVKTNYAGHSYPKLIEFMKELPKTNSGKIIRMKLKELEEKRAGK